MVSTVLVRVRLYSFFSLISLRENPRPRTAEVTLSILQRAKASGFTALAITLDTMALGWRPHDLETAFLPFAYGVGIQVGTSDPVFMKRYGFAPRENERTMFPFEPEKIREAALSRGDKATMQNIMLGKEWLGEVNSGAFRSWEELKFIKDNWEGPIILKGIQRVDVRSFCMCESNLIAFPGRRESHCTWYGRDHCLQSW